MAPRASITTGILAVLSIGLSVAAATPAQAAALPAVRFVSASGSLPAGGGRVAIQGHGFTGVKRVLFGSKRATHVTRLSSKQLKVTVPAHPTGTVRVRVVTNAGKSPKSIVFVYTPPPVITSIKPGVGEPAGNVHIELTGKHFRTVSSGTIGATGVGVAVESDAKILVTVPPMAAGSYDVVVTNLAGSSIPNEHSRYTYAASEPWQLVDSVPGTADGDTEFFGADCESGTCYAVGDKTDDPSARDNVPLIDVEQDSGDWAQATVTPPSDPGAFKDAVLRRVACSAANTCVAFGSDVDWSGPAPVVQPLVAVGSGQSWTTVHPPMPADWEAKNRQPITDAACFEDKCAVVGWFRVGVGASKRLVIDTYANGAWVERSPALVHAAAYNTFDNLAVTCGSTTQCVAVGRNGRKQPIAIDIPLTGSDRATVKNLPVQLSGPQFNVTMDGVACSSAVSCVAVGYRFEPADDSEDDNGPPYAFFERYKDGTWTDHEFAPPASIASHHTSLVRWDFPSVDCVTGGTCYAVGGLETTFKSSQGSQWKYAATVTRITDAGQQSVFAAVPDPYANESILGSVFCGDQPTCVAFGYQGTPSIDGDGPLTDVTQFTVHIGSKDRPRVYSGPTFDSHHSDPAAVACATPEHCIAVGSHNVPDGSGTRSVAWIQES